MLENPSTTINKEFLPFFDLGNPKTKSMEISIQGLVGIGNGVYNPYGCTLDFVFILAMHYSHIRCTSLLIFGQ
jgi:hypothetical protein